MRRWKLIVLCAVAGAICAFSFTEIFIAPTYQSGGLLYVSNTQLKSQQAEISAQQQQAAYNLVVTYSEILKSETFTTIVAEDLGGAVTPAEVENMVTYEAVGETELMQVSVISTDPTIAYEVARSVIANAPGFLTGIAGGEVTEIDNAKEPTAPIGPSTMKNTAIGVLGGLVIGVMLAVLLHILDTRVRSGEELAEKYGIPVLGEIPGWDTLMKGGTADENGQDKK